MLASARHLLHTQCHTMAPIVFAIALVDSFAIRRGRIIDELHRAEIEKPRRELR